MTGDIDNLIKRGGTLTGSKLLEAIKAATGKVVGGRGIRVNTINRDTVVSLKGNPILGGGGGGQSVPGVITDVDTPSGFNANYRVRSVDGSSLPETTAFIQPNNRMFDTAVVDFEAATVGEYVRIWGLLPFPLVAPPMESGACIDSDGNCLIKTGAGGGKDQCPLTALYFAGEPCAFIDVAELVRTRVCPSAASAVLPPPKLIKEGLLG